MIDIVDVNPRVAADKSYQVTHGRHQIIRTQRHFVFRHLKTEFSVDAESADLAEPIAIRVEELFVKQRAGLFQLGRISWTQSLIDPQQRLFVTRCVVFGEAVKNKRRAGFRHDMRGSHSRRTNRLSGVLCNLVPRFDDDLTGAVTLRRIDNVINGIFAFDLTGAAAINDFGNGRFVEAADDIAIEAVLRVHRPHQRHRREFATLVDPYRQAVLFADIDFDPASALRNNTATVQQPIAGIGFSDKIHTRRTVQLANHYALGTIDDELAATQHNWHIAQIDLFLNRLFFGQPQPDSERSAVSESQLTTLIRFVTRFTQLVAQVLEPQCLVVAFDRKNFLQDRFKSRTLAIFHAQFILKKSLITGRLNIGQTGHWVFIPATSEATDVRRVQASFCRGGHRRQTPSGDSMTWSGFCKRR